MTLRPSPLKNQIRTSLRSDRGGAIVEGIYAISFFLILVGGCFDMYLRFMSRTEAEMRLLDFARAVEISRARDAAYQASSPQSIDIRLYDIDTQGLAGQLNTDPAVRKFSDLLYSKALPGPNNFYMLFDNSKKSITIVYKHQAKCLFCANFAGSSGRFSKDGGYWSGQQTVTFEKPLFDYNYN